ncbi:MAG: hypothetical protein SGI89_00525 [bacterium]|nr:hypothetical protein [bacterium]
MKLKYFLYTIFLVVVIAGCSSTQSSMYKPGDGNAGWNVKVTKTAALGDEFVCKINDSTVVTGAFPFIGDNFEKSGMYRGKKVMMNGYRSSTSITESNGNVKTTDKFQIRVFIDDTLIDKFDF